MLGQALLTKRMGKTRVIAETGAGQHGVATATACALLGLECVVYMGEVDTQRQALNVARMRLLGATVIPVTTGARTLKDAINEALRDWVSTSTPPTTCWAPSRGRTRSRRWCATSTASSAWRPASRCSSASGGCRTRSRPASAAAPTRSGSSTPSSTTRACASSASSPAATASRPGGTRATLSEGSPGALHGAMSYLLQDEDGQTAESYSISAGLDYPGVGPEHALLKDIGRATYESVTDAEAMDAFALLCRSEGIIPAIESAHAVAGALRLGRELGPEAVILVNLSGRGDKDVDTAAKWFKL